MSAAFVFGQAEAEAESATGAVLDRNLSAVSKHGVLDNRQAEACASGLSRTARVYAVESLEYMRQMLLAYACAVIAEEEVVEIIVFACA